MHVPVDCRVDGTLCTPENLNPALGCDPPWSTCVARWQAITTDLAPVYYHANDRIPRLDDDELFVSRVLWERAGQVPQQLFMGVECGVQARLFLAMPHTLAVAEGTNGMLLLQPRYNPNGLKRFYIHLDRREMPFKAGQMWLERAHVALRPDGFRVWSAGAAEPVWIPRPSPDDGWRELIAASAELDPRGYDSDTLVIALQPEVRFWVLWRALALIGLRYPDGAFDGAADLDAVRPRMDGDEPERRFRRVWLTVDSTD